MNEPTKVCKQCEQEKSLSLFNANHLAKDGRWNTCKQCVYTITANMKEKQCKECNEVKEISHFQKLNFSKDGYRNVCLECEEARKVIYDKSIRKCTKCNEVKSIGEYTKTKNSKDGYYYNCNECLNTPEVIVSEKECEECHEVKGVHQFAKSHRTPDGYLRYCRECRPKVNRRNQKEKECNTCKETKFVDRFMLNRFSYYPYSDNCIDCERARIKNIEGRVCSQCNTYKEVIYYSATTNGGTNTKCRECQTLIDQERAGYRRAVGTEPQEILKVKLNGEEISVMKCVQCKELHPLSNYSTRNGKLFSKCNKCKGTIRRVSPSISKQVIPKGEKQCNKCKGVKPIAEFPTRITGFANRATTCLACHASARQDMYDEFDKYDSMF